MSERLVTFALSQRVFILIVSLIIIAFGIYSITRLPVDAYPDVSPNQVKIILKSSGMTPAEIESRVVVPIEQNMQNIPNQTVTRSLSKYGICDITIDFKDGVDIYWARAQVAQKLSEAMDDLPSGISGGLAPITTPLGEVLMFSVESKTLSLTEKRTLLDWVINKRIRPIDGVAEVNALGGFVKSYEIIPDYLKMKQHGITMQNLQDTIIKNNQNDGIGRLSLGEQSLFVRSEGRVKNIDEISNLIIKQDGGANIRISDVSSVEIGSLVRSGFVTKDGKGEAVEGLILARKGVDASLLLKNVKAEIQKIQKDLPKGTKIEIFYDRSDLVGKAINTVAKALLEALLLIVIILYVFLGNFRASFNVAIILPFAILMTFISMDYFGISANLMSLGGVSIAIGMLVDASVVMVENISERLQSERYKNIPKYSVVLESAKEVSNSIFIGVLIIIIVFLPLLTLEGLEGKLFVPVALSVVFALAASLLLTLTFIPIVSLYVLKQETHAKSAIVLFLEKNYGIVLDYALSHQKHIFIAVLILWIATIGAFTQVGKTFMPNLDEGNIIISVEKSSSISLEASREIDTKIQKALMRDVPEIISIVARSGSDEIGLDPMGLNETDTFLVLKPKKEWRNPSKEVLLERIRKVLDEFIGVKYSFTQPIQMKISEMLSGSRGDIVVKTYGEGSEKLDSISKNVVKIAKSIKGNSDVYKKSNEGVAYWELNFKDDAMSRYGVSRDELSAYLKSVVDGVKVGIIQEELRRIPLVISGSNEMRTSMSQNANLQYILKDGSSVELNELVEFKMTQGAVQVEHENTMRKSSVMINVEGRDLVGFVDELSTKIEKEIKLPSGYFIEYAGEYKNQQRASKKLTIVIPIAIFLIFVLLLVTFRSTLQAFLIIMNIPFALIGGIIGLYLNSEYMSIPASVGFIALMGIAVLNGIVMVSYFNQLAEKIDNPLEVVKQGAIRRVRPVLMTAFIAALGLVPMLLATGPGSEIQKPLAIVVVNGLVSSTFLTLILLPILYRRFVLKD